MDFDRDRSKIVRRLPEILACVLVAWLAPAAVSQTTINGNSLAMRSNGASAGGGAWSLSDNGYVGTYITLPAAGNVTVAVQASGSASSGINPRMNVVIADSMASFDVAAGNSTYQQTFSLPAGTHFLRTEFNNDFENSGRQLTVRSVTVTGASVSNASNNANALAAANTYINQYRKGNVSVGLSGVAPGTPIEVSLKRHAFNFGTAVPGVTTANVNTYLGPTSDPNSTAYKFQQALAQSKFNALVPENAGKWASNAPVSANSFDMSNVDTILNFAEAHNMRARMHNLVWGDQQPNWVNTLMNQALGGNAAAANTLRTEISERIDYYVADRAHRYYELDVYNETVHTPEYWDIYGASGIAAIYNETAAAVAEAGGSTRLFTNEYNVLQDSGDFYGNWYMRNVEDIVSAGGAVSGIGVQAYENNAIGPTFDAHNPARKMQTLQNLSVLGMPITLTEFGVKDPTNQTDAATMLDDTARLVFGTPDATGFFMWGFWRGQIFRGAAAFYDQNWNLTIPGQRWQDLLSIDTDANVNDDWDTQLTAFVGEDGTINFNGFWGDYELTIYGQSFPLTLVKGDAAYSLAVRPGDYNADGTVDAADYVVWRKAAASAGGLRADGNGDGFVNAADYDEWRAQFGANYGSSLSSGATVPEPCMTSILAIAAAVSLFGRRRKRRRLPLAATRLAQGLPPREGRLRRW